MGAETSDGPVSSEASGITKKEGRIIKGLMATMLVTGATFGYIANDPAERHYGKLDVVPACEDARGSNEALIPVPDEQIAQAIGRSAVCKVDNSVLKIVARAPQK